MPILRISNFHVGIEQSENEGEDEAEWNAARNRVRKQQASGTCRRKNGQRNPCVVFKSNTDRKGARGGMSSLDRSGPSRASVCGYCSTG